MRRTGREKGKGTGRGERNERRGEELAEATAALGPEPPSAPGHASYQRTATDDQDPGAEARSMSALFWCS